MKRLPIILALGLAAGSAAAVAANASLPAATADAAGLAARAAVAGSTAPGGGAVAGRARAALGAFAHGIHSLSASFTQVVTGANGRKAQTVEGTLALQEPRQFRWQTLAPQKQLIVADGSRVWIYDPELEQVTVRKQSVEEAHSPLTVLTDLSRLDRQFKASEAGRRDGLQWLRLTPRVADAQFAYAELGFDGATLREMVFADKLGSRSELRFSDWQRNPTLPASTFQFTPPPDADVIGGP
ncbi:MAG TPA: outer membrane lipoprotein chaperone LolA [Rhodanobacteraceae bacterium]|nr:outer membrane lipoprotein chaperone LolA [Rhodanobacteraceae bacterium]